MRRHGGSVRVSKSIPQIFWIQAHGCAAWRFEVDGSPLRGQVNSRLGFRGIFERETDNHATVRLNFMPIESCTAPPP
jgi:hypothetical protein